MGRRGEVGDDFGGASVSVSFPVVSIALSSVSQCHSR